MFTRRRSATASRMRAVRFTRKARLGQPDGTRPNRLRHRDWSGLISNRRISSHGDSVIRWCCTRAESVLPSLLRLKGEIGSPWLAGGNRHLFRLGAIVFLPRSQGVAPRRHVFDRVVAVTVGGCVRPFDHNEPAVHPGMNVALHWNRDFLGLQLFSIAALQVAERDSTGYYRSSGLDSGECCEPSDRWLPP